MPEFQVTWIDVVIVVAYIVITIAIGVWFARGKNDTEGYFLGGRNFLWPLVGLSLFATKPVWNIVYRVVQFWIREWHCGLQLRVDRRGDPRVLRGVFPAFLPAFQGVYHAGISGTQV